MRTEVSSPALHGIEDLACTVCRSRLDASPTEVRCPECGRTYTIENGIPCIPPPGNVLTVAPERLRIKEPDEALATIAADRAANFGWIQLPRHFYLLYALILGCVIARFGWGVAGGCAVLLADWIIYLLKRRRTLARWASHPLRLLTLEDHRAIDALYRSEGKTPPTMQDFLNAFKKVAAERTAPSPAGQGPEGGADFDEERYRDILRVYETRPARPTVTVDVGANDGRACWEFGIGRGGRYIGIDVNSQLLGMLRSRIPAATVVLADGSCLPLPDESAEFIICTETLEHLTDPAAALAEFARVLRPGGCFVVQSPNAHRIRNLNLLHVLSLVAGLAVDHVLQKKTVHENTWVTATSYHWDFSVGDYKRLARGLPLRNVRIESRSFFCPRFLLRGRASRYRAKEAFHRAIPVLRLLGDDLVLVAEKARG